MSKQIIHIFVITVIFSLFHGNIARSQVLIRDLNQGMTGEDVRSLQIFLNTDRDTRVALSGPGSVGQESTYFGSLTREAVIKFQEKYATDVLFPIGLSKGTGYVGAMTMRKINSIPQAEKFIFQADKSITPNIAVVVPIDKQIDIYQTDGKFNNIRDEVMTKINNAVANRTTPDINFDSYKLDPNLVFIRNISSQQGPVGSNVTIQGNGFLDINDVYIGKGYIISNIRAFGGGLNIIIPPIPIGRYDIAIKNKSGVSNTVVFVVRDQNSSTVRIDSITPNKVVYGQKLTIYGLGFTNTGNEVITDVGKFKNLSSSDGHSITFNLEPENLREIARVGDKSFKMPVGVSVINNNGITSEQTFFTFEL